MCKKYPPLTFDRVLNTPLQDSQQNVFPGVNFPETSRLKATPTETGFCTL